MMTKRSRFLMMAAWSLALCTMAMAADVVPAVEPESRPDQALVYFFRTQSEFGPGVTIYLFADESFVGVLEGASYGFAHVEPGTRLFWTTFTRATRELQLVAGKTYYLDVWTDISMLDEAWGKAHIESLGRRVVPTAREIEKAESFIETRHEGALWREARKDKAPHAVIAPGAPGAEAPGTIKLPSGSRISLELIENISSGINEVGDPVWFEVAEDCVVGEQIILRRGTRVRGTVHQVASRGPGGRRGTIDVTVDVITAADGIAIPTVGRIVAAGQDRSATSINTTVLVGVFGLMVRGRDAYSLAGARFEAVTREDVWLAPVREEPGDAPRPDAPGPELELNGHFPHDVRFAPAKGSVSGDVKLVLISDSEPLEATIYAIGGRVLPEPIPLQTEGYKNGISVNYVPGRQLVRFVQPCESREFSAEIHGRLSSGEIFLSRTHFNLRFEE